MRYRLSSALAVLIALSATPAAAEDLVTGQMPSEIRIRSQAPGIFRVNNITRRFETNVMAPAGPIGQLRYQLLEIEQSQELVEGPEIETQFGAASVVVSAYPLNDQGKGAKAFEIRMAGDKVAVNGPYLTITKYGCCAEQGTHAVFSLENGNYLFNATGAGASGDWVTLGARGGFQNERIIAFHVIPTPFDLEILNEIPDAVAAITYARRDRSLQRLALIASPAAIAADVELDWWATATLLSPGNRKESDRIFIEHDGKAEEIFTDAVYRLSLDDATVVEIPIVADRLDIGGAKLPAGYRLLEMNLAAQPYP